MSVVAPLIDVAALARAVSSPHPPLLLDASFSLADPQEGRRAYEAAHVPGAHYVDLDRDLCGPKSGVNGRHPLPARADWIATLCRLGVTADRHVVVMDRGNAMFAARLWWMLLWAGHPAAQVQVLDGGMQAWVAAGLPTAQGPDTPGLAASGLGHPPPGVAAVTLDAAAVLALLPTIAAGQRPLVDARAPERFRGDVEPLDPVAGHIPGALNRPFTDNLQADGRFLPATTLREAWQPLLGSDPASAIHQCGSGVTACHNLLATVVAGWPLGQLYAGSWSEWCADSARPMARGPASG